MTQKNTVSLPKLARAVENMPPSGIRRFFDIAAKMQDVISLGVGEPDFVTPWSIREAAIYSLERGFTTYTSNYGLLELREALAAYIYRLYGVIYNPESEIVITAGVSEGLDLAMRAVLDPGDEVLIPEPAYVSYKPCVILAGGVPVPIITDPEDQFRPRVEKLEQALTAKTKALLLGFPANPTGATLTRAEAERIVQFAKAKNIFLISDEIYDRLVYEDDHVCIASLPDARERTILLNGFSKAYAMTGWRVGYACAPANILAGLVKIHAYSALCASITGQKAALEALSS